MLPRTSVSTVVENRRYRNFAPFVRQTGERKAQICAKGISQQLQVFPREIGRGRFPNSEPHPPRHRDLKWLVMLLYQLAVQVAAGVHA